jgi:hypothetical protein
MSMVIENHTQRTIGRLGASTAVVKESSLMCILYNALLMGGEWIKTVKTCNIASVVDEEESELL